MYIQGKIIDSELAVRVKHGEKEAYKVLFERYASRIYQFSYSYLSSKQDSEELVQNVFLKIWEQREVLDQSKNIKSFIFKIAVNAIYDFIRKKNVENAFLDFAAVNFEIESNNTWHAIIYEEMLSELQLLIGQFPEQRKRIFRLRMEEGMSNEDIAQKLKLSKRTVENQLYRATAFLKEHFKSESVFTLLFYYLWVA